MSEPTVPFERRPKHDAIIVGASVAGCRAALTLAQKGKSVLLLDRADFPRWKPCAGGLTLKTRPYLPDPLFQLVESTVRDSYLALGKDYVTHIHSENPMGWLVHRETFDQVHLELARRQPSVDISLGTHVRAIRELSEGVVVETDSGEVRAPVLVGADGATSVVSKSLPGHEKRHMAFAYEGEALFAAPGGSEATGTTHFEFKKFPGGYGWVFPKKDHISVGGFIYDGKAPGLKGLFQEFCAETEDLGGARPYRERGHPVCLGGGSRRLNSKRMVLVGEAGGLVDPLTGEGIYYALRSGHLAGEAIGRFLDHGTPLDAYGDGVRREIQEGFRPARAIADFLYRHPRLAFHLLLRNSMACRWFAEICAGQKTYERMLSRFFRSSLALPFHTGFGKRQEVEVEMPQGFQVPTP
jgi:geranylgeranyl reductase family protein